MFGLIRTFFGKSRYRRRWGRLAAAAADTADRATADLDRRRRSRSGKRQRATDEGPIAPRRLPSSAE